MKVTANENQSQISTLKITNSFPRSVNVIPMTKSCNKKIWSNFKYFDHYPFFPRLSMYINIILNCKDF